MPASETMGRRGVLFNRKLFCWPVLLLAGLTAGCSGEYKPPPPSDVSVAKDALEKALNLWRSKVTLSELRTLTPPITMFDEDWDADLRLLEFQLLPGEQAAGSTIRWPARLRVVRRDG